VVDLGVLIDTGDKVSERLFGLSKMYRSDRALRESSLFADRGLPPVRSAAVDDEWNRHCELAEQHGREKSGIGGYTFASYSEILKIGLVDSDLSRSDWQLVFQIADLIVASKRHTPEKIRFTVWYNW